MGRLLRAWLVDESGATAIEYGLMAALVAVAAIVAMTLAGGSLQALFNHTASRATSVWNNVQMN